MLSYLIRRILLIVPTLIGATALIFFVIELSPINIKASLLSAEGTIQPGERAAREAYLNKRYGLDKPAPVRYLRWLNRISPLGFRDPPDDWSFRFKWPDLGDSVKKSRPVGDVIGDALPVTIMMQAIAIPISYTIAILLGIWTAKHRGKVQDVATGTALLAMWSLPVIWVSVMLIGFFTNQHYFKWFPTGELHDKAAAEWSFFPGGGTRGWLVDMGWHLILPIVCLAYGNFAYLSKLTRASLLDTMQADFVRTARAKGLGERVVLYRHAFRNSLLPLITVFGSLLPALIVGSVVVERVFSINGMGNLVVEAMQTGDMELFLSVSAITIVLALVGNLLADIGYMAADPRVTYE
ncbi:MAG TPA: ABC transporter permease [Tepidisphaeraceae bacterium]|nr:ABC transporter permease [Tepidisphaeraceae bacterium]